MQRRQLIKTLITLTVGSVFAGLATTSFAKRGRPMTPTSVAGVNRRRRRRRRRRISRNMRLYHLPYGCNVTRIRGGITYYYCGNIWYRPAYQGTTVIYIVEEIEPGANLDVEFEEYE